MTFQETQKKLFSEKDWQLMVNWMIRKYVENGLTHILHELSKLAFCLKILREFYDCYNYLTVSWEFVVAVGVFVNKMYFNYKLVLLK
jgi:hypothetical protein